MQDIPPYLHIIITIDARDGSGYDERLRTGGYMPVEMHYAAGLKGGYPAVMTPGGSDELKDVGGYGVYSLQSKDFELVLSDAPFMTIAPVGNQSYGIAMDGAWNLYRFDLITGNYTNVGNLDGQGLGKYAAGKIMSFAVAQ